MTRDEQPPPPLPATNAPTARDDPAAPLHASNPTAANDMEGVVSSPAYSPDYIAAQATVGKDSAPQRETGDGDVIMAEAVPIAPVSSEQSKGQEVRTESPLPINLPPPPPRASQSQAAVGVGRSQSNATAPNERPPWLLPPLQPRFQGKKCLVLDLDETLVHSSFKVSSKKWPGIFEIEGQYHNVYVIKRPGVDQFMKRVGELYEVVVFTASVSKVRNTANLQHISLLTCIISTGIPF